ALREAVRDGEAEEAGGGGEAAEAASALAALRALRAAPAPRLAAALRAAPHARSLAALSRLLGASGAPGAHEAAVGELALDASDAPPPALHYLHALALAHEPHESVVLDALRLAEEARSAEVREAALLAAAAGAARLGGRASAVLRDALPRLLARCMVSASPRPRRSAARRPMSRAFSVRRQDDETAERARPLEQRAAALDLVLVRAAPLPPPLALARLARELKTHGPAELRRLFWQRARQLAAEHRPLADVLAMLEPDLRGWDALAQPGTSSVLVRSLGRMGEGPARLESLQLTSGGLLRRGAVTLLADGAPQPLLALELWTRGLEALAGEGEAAEGEGEGAAEEASGGLELAVGGARLPGLTLFAGQVGAGGGGRGGAVRGGARLIAGHPQAELLGHVWAGRGSSATPALRALLPLQERALRVPLLGAGPLRLRLSRAAALALDAQAQVSLWSRTARAELELRLGAAGEVRAELSGAAGRLSARAAFAAEPRLRVAADLDFYERVALCVRAATEDAPRRARSALASRLGARSAAVRRRRRSATPQPGRTLQLGEANSAACRALPP
ncbi:unnamed protein product, partial [Iphiclides podalirius]